MRRLFNALAAGSLALAACFALAARAAATYNGAVGGGTLTLDANGVVTAAAGLQLSLQGGTGQYEGVSGGSGSLSLSTDPENASKLGGPLRFDF